MAASAGMELVIAVLLGFYLGQWADRKLGSEPWGLLLGAALGIIVGIYGLIRNVVQSPPRRP